MPGVRITADVANNSVLVYATQEAHRIVEQTLQQIDRPQLQVAIDATIAEVTLNDQLTYGVQFYLNSKEIGLKPDKGSAHQQPRPARVIAAAAARLQLPDRLGGGAAT